MKTSLCVAHVPSPQLDTMLDTCLASAKGYDELVLVVNDGIGYGAAFNRAFKYARGEYLVLLSNDVVIRSGTIEDLIDPEAVTCPVVNGKAQEFWGCMFCLPRWVYEKIGGFDERFGIAYFEDDDYIFRLREAGIPMRSVDKVQVEHAGGVTVKHLGAESHSYYESRQRFIEKWGRTP